MEVPEIPDSISTIIFDLDGTLINSEPLHAKALALLLGKIGLNATPEELIERFCGLPDDQVYYEIFNENSQVQLPQFIREKTTQLLTIINAIEPSEMLEMVTPGVVEAIQFLHAQGKKMAVGSASEVAVVQTIIQRLSLSSYFPIVKGRTDTFQSKPNPSIYLSIMRDYTVSSDEVLIFEDSLPGVQAANQTGSYVIRVGDPEEENPLFSDFDDLAVIDNFFWLVDEDTKEVCQDSEAES